MRKSFISGLVELASTDERILLLTADLGYGTVEEFADNFPRRFINVGVAEQGMIGVATGLAEAGYIPYCYTIASFAVARTFEFLRNGPIAHGLPVRLIGVGPGMDYSFDGFTHYSLEDLTLLMNQPRTLIISPRNDEYAKVWGRAAVNHDGLIYYRLARASDFLWNPEYMPDGQIDIAIICLGESVEIGHRIRQKLTEFDLRIALLSEEIISQESMEKLVSLVVGGDPAIIITVENHYVSGGFGEKISLMLLQSQWSGVTINWGIVTPPLSVVGNIDQMLELHCPSVEEIVLRVRDILNERNVSK